MQGGMRKFIAENFVQILSIAIVAGNLWLFQRLQPVVDQITRNEWRIAQIESDISEIKNDYIPKAVLEEKLQNILNQLAILNRTLNKGEEL